MWLKLTNKLKQDNVDVVRPSWDFSFLSYLEQHEGSKNRDGSINYNGIVIKVMKKTIFNIEILYI